MSKTYFQGMGYNSRGEKSQGTDERCRNCIYVCGDHYNGQCPCEYCDGIVVHPVGFDCPNKRRETGNESTNE